MIIAIDGPAGAGKSTVSKLVAKQLGFSCLDTGAMYRAVTWFALNHGIATDDVKSLTDIAQNRLIAFENEEGNPAPKKVYIDGIDVTNEIRTAEIDKNVTPVCQIPSVREALVDQQRIIGSQYSYVVDGRDIGTVVFPQAEVKVFLTASAEERARRRVAQNEERGVGSTDFDEVLADIIRRDEADTNRETSPLKQADDAILVDSTGMEIDEVVQKICQLANSR